MKRKNIFVYILLAFVAILYFTPKTNLYYKLEHELQSYGIVIHNEHVDDRWFWLDIMNAQLYVQGLESLHAKHTRIMLFGFYNTLNIEDVTLASTLGQFIPKEVKTITLEHLFYDPLNIRGRVEGEFGYAEINLDLYNRIFSAKVIASKQMKRRFSPTLKNFTRDSKGAYHYEYRF